jgi:predicted ABC-type ATPase
MTCALDQSAPLLIILFGATGSGKSTMLDKYIKHVLKADPSDFTLCNVDSLVENSPEWLAIRKEGNVPTQDDYFRIRKAYADAINDERIRICINTKRNFVFETTGESYGSVSWLKALIAKCLSNGFVVHLMWPFVDVEDLLRRVAARARETGLTVPEERVRAGFEQGSHSFLDLLPLANRAMIIDNSTMVKDINAHTLFQLQPRKGSWMMPDSSCSPHMMDIMLFQEDKKKWSAWCRQDNPEQKTA